MTTDVPDCAIRRGDRALVQHVYKNHAVIELLTLCSRVRLIAFPYQIYPV